MPSKFQVQLREARESLDPEDYKAGVYLSPRACKHVEDLIEATRILAADCQLAQPVETWQELQNVVTALAALDGAE